MNYCSKVTSSLSLVTFRVLINHMARGYCFWQHRPGHLHHHGKWCWPARQKHSQPWVNCAIILLCTYPQRAEGGCREPHNRADSYHLELSHTFEESTQYCRVLVGCLFFHFLRQWFHTFSSHLPGPFLSLSADDLCHVSLRKWKPSDTNTGLFSLPILQPTFRLTWSSLFPSNCNAGPMHGIPPLSPNPRSSPDAPNFSLYPMVMPISKATGFSIADLRELRWPPHLLPAFALCPSS